IAATGGNVSVQSAKDATGTIPIVFTVGYDPVAAGLVASLGRPGGNLTGVTFFSTELTGKQFELLALLIPNLRAGGFLLGPGGPEAAQLFPKAEAAARTLGLELHVAKVANERDIDDALADLSRRKVGGFVYGSDPFFIGKSTQIIALATRYGIPSIIST